MSDYDEGYNAGYADAIEKYSREADAKDIYAAGLHNVLFNPVPEGQKFPPGTRVRIDDNLHKRMAHFPAGANATVCYTYAHAYGGKDVKSYSLDIDGHGQVSWYPESALTKIEES